MAVNKNNIVDFGEYKTNYTTIDREISVLSGLLSGNFDVVEFVETFQTFWFLSREHQAISEAIKESFSSKLDVNPLSISVLLKDIVPEDYIYRLSQGFIPLGELATYRTLMKNGFINRNLKEAVSVASSISENGDPELAIIELKRFVDEIGSDVYKDDKTSNEEARNLAIQMLKDKANGLLVGVPTGLAELDSITEGLNPTEFVVCAARPGMGKSALATTISNNVAIRSKRPIVYYTLEMNKVDLVKRILQCEAKSSVSFSRMEQVVIPENYKILYKPSLTLDELRISMTKEQALLPPNENLSLVVVDHIGLVKVPSAKTSYEVMKAVTHELKALAGEFNTCVLGLCQLNRAVESRDNKQPAMSDLRDSGSIEEDADEVWLLYRPDYYKPPNEPKDNQAFVCVGKNRDGACGVAQLVFNPSLTLFS